MCSLTNRRGYLDAVQQGRVARVRGEFGWSKVDDVVIFFYQNTTMMMMMTMMTMEDHLQPCGVRSG
jgi:hypothetical protein